MFVTPDSIVPDEYDPQELNRFAYCRNNPLIYTDPTFGSRYFDPDTARFITQDSYLGEQGTPPSLDRYLYAYANPTVYIDLLGYDPMWYQTEQWKKNNKTEGGFLQDLEKQKIEYEQRQKEKAEIERQQGEAGRWSLSIESRRSEANITTENVTGNQNQTSQSVLAPNGQDRELTAVEFQQKYHLSNEFINKVDKMAKNLETKSEYLLAIMAFESNFSSVVRNKYTGAAGFIQITEPNAARLKTTTQELVDMSMLDQLDYVEAYLIPYKGKMKTIEDAYMAVLMPGRGLGKPNNFVLMQEDVSEFKIEKERKRRKEEWEGNQELDFNFNGEITKEEACTNVKRLLSGKGNVARGQGPIRNLSTKESLDKYLNFYRLVK